MDSLTLHLDDEAATRRFSGCLARGLSTIALAEQGIAVHLSGDLGAGKTTFVRHLLAHLGIEGPVKSPSYALLESYNGPSFMVYHFDLYRFSSPEQWIDAGFDDIVAGPGLVLVEWPEQAIGVVPPPDLRLRLEIEVPADSDPVAGPRDGGRDDGHDGCQDGGPGADPAGGTGRRLAVTAFSPAGRQCLTVAARCWSPGATG